MMNVIKFTRIIDIVQRILACRDDYPSLKFTGRFVYEYICMCEYYGLEWTSYNSIETIEEYRGEVKIHSITISISAFAYPEFMDTMQCIYGAHVEHIDCSQSSIQLCFPNIVSVGSDIFTIFVTTNNGCGTEASIHNVCWDGVHCSLRDAFSFQFISDMEERIGRTLTLIDPCVRNHVYSKFVLGDIYNKRAVMYPMFMTPIDLITKAYGLSMDDGYHVTADLPELKIEVRPIPYVCGEEVNVSEDCSICQDTMGLGDLFGARTIVRLKCGNVMHSFHLNCITRWVVQAKNSCPMCRKPIDDPSLFQVYSKTQLYYSSSS